ncbi:MAG: hypothetical protein HY852_03530 [Bradyrhizobium sp.]|uniref:phage tail tape measure protein n=1 Tax=Bradyrhizobium sp. TaxID=376 RepID=UPI0025BB3684|nr:phage tail tape measure protein [Bradyrhizobium sp.]MBI5260874.1 hypothetical protein [Bradyrhizobium sp.]
MAAVFGGIQLQKWADGFASSLTSAFGHADELGKAAQKWGIPVEELSKLQHAAALSDLSIEQLGGGVGKFSKNLVESLGNPSTAAARALTSLGISAKDSGGQLRPTSDIISDIAERFAGMKDGAGKTALAIALFGKSGADLIPMLNSGKTGLKEMKDEAAALGLTITDRTAKAAEAFNDNLTRLNAAKNGIVMTISARLAPALADISGRFIKFVKDNDLVTKAADGFSRAILFVSDNVKLLGNLLGIFVGSQIVGAVAAIAMSFVTFARSIAAATLATTMLNAAKAISIARIAAFAGVIIYATGNMPAFIEQLEKIGTAVAGMLPKGASDSISQGLKNIGLDTEALTAEIEKLGTASEEAKKKLKDPPKVASEEEIAKMKAYNAQLANLSIRTRITKGDFDALAPGFALAALQLGLFGDKGQKAVTTLEGLTPKMAMLNTELLKNAAVNALQTIETPYDRLAKSVAVYDMMLRENEITVEQHRALSVKAAEDMGLGWQAMGNSLASFSGAMSQLTGTFAKNNKTMGIASKAFGIAQAIINTQMAATKALAFYGPTPLGYAGVAAAIAQGAASVATISAQSFASGGLVQGPGTGTSDSVLARLSAGEFVMPAAMTREFYPELNAMHRGEYPFPPDHAAGAPGVSTAPKIVEVRGLGRDKTYNHDDIRMIIEGINGLVADGYVLKVT